MINGNTAAESVPATCLKSQNNMSLINHHSTGLLDSGDEISQFFHNYQKIIASGLYNFECCKISLRTRLNIPFFQFMLADYDDVAIVELLKYGFPIGFAGKLSKKQGPIKNHRGVIEYPKEVQKYLEKEKHYGAILGPFDQVPFSEDFCISPLNTVSKKDSLERRVILDLSFPEGSSINEGISKDFYLGSKTDLTFPRVDDLVDLIKLKGRHCHLYKRDLKRAYRQIPVDLSDVPLLGYCFEGRYYFDKYLSMGLRSAAYICQRVTNAIRFMCQMLHIAIVNYLDDFAGAEQPDLALKSFQELGNLLVSCGIEESAEKACPPSTKMIFIGVLFDTDELTLSVTEERVNEILELVNTWLQKKSASLQDLQSLVGKLNFISACVHASRVFICRILNWLRLIQDKKSAQLIPAFVKKDLVWWKKFLPTFNGVSMMLLEEWSKPDELFACDACPSGCGGISRDEYFHEEFPSSIAQLKMHINALELLTLVVALKVWGSRLRGKRVLMFCDNMSSVNLINKGLSRDDFHQSCLREICFTAAVNNFAIKAQHTRGEDNRLADILSRWHLHANSEQVFKDLVKGKKLSRVSVDSSLFSFSNPW